uniref:Uncharacterized protein n=1 Tax=Anguilla anguilla TaxID=7936 RepID=A0A0E9USK4_ANGAN
MVMPMWTRVKFNKQNIKLY